MNIDYIGLIGALGSSLAKNWSKPQEDHKAKLYTPTSFPNRWVQGLGFNHNWCPGAEPSPCVLYELYTPAQGSCFEEGAFK